jgi:hypothetical protein
VITKNDRKSQISHLLLIYAMQAMVHGRRQSAEPSQKEHQFRSEERRLFSAGAMLILRGESSLIRRTTCE